MGTIEICVSFIVAILGIAYPILVQVVSSLDTKYNSVLVLELFAKEKVRKAFSLFLFSSLTLIGAIIVVTSILKVIGEYFNIYIDSLIEIIDVTLINLLFISTSLLIACFIKLVSIILKYYSPPDFLKYLKRRHEIESQKSDYTCWRIITDILCSSIKNKNEITTKEISNFVYIEFQKFRDECITGEKIIYPDSFYETINKVTSEVIEINSSKFVYIEHRVMGIWQFGELSNAKTSKETFNNLWYNLVIASENDRDEMLLFYWRNAHQYFGFFLQPIPYEFEGGKVKNQDLINVRKFEREQFLEFNYAFGSLLFWQSKYECINRILSYSTSTPPRYELLPSNVYDIFSIAFTFIDRTNYYLNGRYKFPGTEGTMADQLFLEALLKYLSLLYLRLFFVRNLNSISKLTLDKFPKLLSDKKNWIDNLSLFKSSVEDLYSNESIKLAFGIESLNDKWCTDKNILNPILHFEEFKKEMISDFELALRTQNISEEKVKSFENDSKNLLTQCFEDYLRLDNKNWKGGNSVTRKFEGVNEIFEKTIFAKQTFYSYIGFTEFLAKKVVFYFQNFATSFFYQKKSRTYVLSVDDLDEALKRMKINSKEHLIVSFGTLTDLVNYKFESIPTLNFKIADYRIFNESIFIIRQDQLPKISFYQVDQSEVEKYKLIKLDDKYNIYSSIIDLSKENKIMDEFIDHEEAELLKSVLATIRLNINFEWEQKTVIHQISILSPYDNLGLKTEFKDIYEFK